MPGDVPSSPIRDGDDATAADLLRLYGEDVIGFASACRLSGGVDRPSALERLDLAGLDAALAAGEVFLPMTLVTGVFGMNVAGLPGTQDPAAFWWVMLGMAASALLLLGLLRLRRLF